jgi:membrane dipeptidase
LIVTGDRLVGRAGEVHAEAVVWDQHACLPLDPDTDFQSVQRYRQAGATFVSINVGYAPQGIAETIRILSSFRHHVLARQEDYLLVQTAADVTEAKRSERLGIAFDLEDANPLEGRVELVQTYYDLGVRTMLMTYNGRNLAGHGCQDDPHGGLTEFGRAVVVEMNRVGMIVDAAHCSYQTSMDLFDTSNDPVVFSHVAMRSVHDHERNITDDQARACAATGGVIGICGVGIFLGENDTRMETLLRHIDHAVSLVGSDHVGLGTDFVFDQDDLNAEFAKNPLLFRNYDLRGPLQFVPPERLPRITESLLSSGYSETDVRGVMGENFLRVAQQVWRA